MQSRLKATPASAALAVALLLAPLPTIAQEAISDEPGTPGAGSDDTADPRATGEAAADDTATADRGAATEAGATEDRPIGTGAAAEGAAPVTAEDEPQDTDTEGTQSTNGGEDPDPGSNIDIAPGRDRTDLAARAAAAAEDAADAADYEAVEEDAEGTETREDEVDTGDRLAAAIASAERAAADIQDAAERLPALVERIDALIARVEGLPLEELVTEFTSLASSTNALVSSEATQALPGSLSSALGEVEAILRELREGGVIDNANATLQSTRIAADSLPGLAERAGVLLDQAGVAIEGFEDSGRVIREAEQALRELARAADAVASLARAIEDDPNSLIFGD